MQTIAFAAAASVIGATCAFAQSGPAKERSGIMRTMQDDAYNPMRQMARGERPYDMAIVEKAYGTIEAGLARAASLWPPNSPSDPAGRFGSSPKVWENRADFEGRLRDARKLISDSKAEAVAGAAGLKAAIAQVDKACGGCHETYRIRQ